MTILRLSDESIRLRINRNLRIKDMAIPNS